MRTCWLAGGGDFAAKGFSPAPDDIVIAVDAGYEKIKELGFEPDIIIGDFDSLGYVPQGETGEIRKHPCQKDDTDMMLAVKEGLSAGCDNFFIFGGMGGRISHTLGNFQVLDFLVQNGSKATLCDGDTTVTTLSEGEITFDGTLQGYISLVPWGCEKAVVSIEGLKYELEKSALVSGRPLGISNEFTGQAAKVQVHEGTVLIVIEQKVS